MPETYWETMSLLVKYKRIEWINLRCKSLVGICLSYWPSSVVINVVLCNYSGLAVQEMKLQPLIILQDLSPVLRRGSFTSTSINYWIEVL